MGQWEQMYGQSLLAHSLLTPKEGDGWRDANLRCKTGGIFGRADNILFPWRTKEAAGAASPTIQDSRHAAERSPAPDGPCAASATTAGAVTRHDPSPARETRPLELPGQAVVLLGSPCWEAGSQELLEESGRERETAPSDIVHGLESGAPAGLLFPHPKHTFFPVLE